MLDARAVETPLLARVGEAIDRGDAAEAKRLLAKMVGDWQRNKDYSINWIVSLLSYIGRELGEAAVEDALRDFGDRFVRARRATAGAGTAPADALEGAPPGGAQARAIGIVRAMQANGSDVEVTEDDEKIELRFRCGSGGMLIDGGAYTDERDYLTLRTPGPVTFGRATLPIYCAHCSVNNEIQPIEWDGAPLTVQFPPEHPGEQCVHHLYKAVIPAEFYARAGKEPPA